MIRTTAAAGLALLFSAGIAAAASATVDTDLNMRSGPGTQYGVVATIPAGATVDVGGCTGSWCAVNYGGASGYASASYLSGGAAAPSAGIAVVPGYAAYDDDTYDYGYSYGPSIGFYAGPRYRHGWHGRPGWQGRPGGWAGRPGWNGRPGGPGRPGGWAGRPGGDSGGVYRSPTGGYNAAPMTGGSAGAPRGPAPSVSAPAGMRGGGGSGPVRSSTGGYNAAPMGR